LILCYVLGPIIRHYTHPRVVGKDNLAALDPPVVFAANHSSHIDTPLLLRALPVRWRLSTAVVAAADYFFRNRLIAGLVSLAFGAIPVDRRTGRSRDSTERLNEVVRSSRSILVYPEGTRSRDGRMGVLRSGAASLALENRIPLVPVHLRGTYEAMPPGRWWPRRNPVTVSFGAPIRPQPGDDRKTLTARLHESLAKLSVEAARDT
jgi:1-acyl-sn-glycerol-3-phosphate acyltransferase